MRDKKGFTLIELLVVISIIAVLMSIMMPALGKVRESGRSVVCKNNLKGIAMSAALWAEDNEGWTVGASWAWPDPILPDDPTSRENPTSLEDYANSSRVKESKSLYACPSAKNAGFFGWSTGNLGNDQEADVAEKRFTYGVNGWISIARSSNGPGTVVTDPAKKGSFGEGVGYVYWYDHGITKLNVIRKPMDTVYFMDHEFYTVVEDNFDPFRAPSNVKTSYAPNGVQSRWHGRNSGDWYGYGNIAWVDGHVTQEPDDFDEPTGPGLFKEPRWAYYFWNH